MTAYCVVKNKNQEESTSLRYLEMIIDKKQKRVHFLAVIIYYNCCGSYFT